MVWTDGLEQECCRFDSPISVLLNRYIDIYIISLTAQSFYWLTQEQQGQNSRCYEGFVLASRFPDNRYPGHDFLFHVPDINHSPISNRSILKKLIKSHCQIKACGFQVSQFKNVRLKSPGADVRQTGSGINKEATLINLLEQKIQLREQNNKRYPNTGNVQRTNELMKHRWTQETKHDTWGEALSA